MEAHFDEINVFIVLKCLEVQCIQWNPQSYCMHADGHFQQAPYGI